LEILVVEKELKEKRAEAKRLADLLKSPKSRWRVVADELKEMRTLYGDKRRTRIGGVGEEVEYSEEAFISDEDAHVVVTRDGWVKRVREMKEPSSTRLREGDEVMAVLSGSLKSNAVFFSNFGTAYVTRFNDIPASTGYGDPVQKLFKFDDGEKVVGALSLDARLTRPETMVAVSKGGFGLRFPLAPHTEASTRAGRRYARPASEDELVGVAPCGPKDVLAVLSERTCALVCKANEVNELSGPGRGVTVMKLEAGDRVVGFLSTSSKNAELAFETNKGKALALSPAKYEVASRGGRGREMSKQDKVKSVHKPYEWVQLPQAKE
jgi:DNA gyrase subunit A